MDGVPHAILCQVMNNKYVLWVDDKFEKTIYRKSYQAVLVVLVIYLWLQKQKHLLLQVLLFCIIEIV